MKAVVIGGNDRRACHYQTIRKKYARKAKAFTRPKGGLGGAIGDPDPIALFTRPAAHGGY
jgi:hypothetical protein